MDWFEGVADFAKLAAWPRAQRSTNHRFHYYTSTIATEDFLRTLESLTAVYRQSQIYVFVHKLNQVLVTHAFLSFSDSIMFE